MHCRKEKERLGGGKRCEEDAVTTEYIAPNYDDADRTKRPIHSWQSIRSPSLQASSNTRRSLLDGGEGETLFSGGTVAAHDVRRRHVAHHHTTTSSGVHRQHHHRYDREDRAIATTRTNTIPCSVTIAAPTTTQPLFLDWDLCSAAAAEAGW